MQKNFIIKTEESQCFPLKKARKRIKKAEIHRKRSGKRRKKRRKKEKRKKIKKILKKWQKTVDKVYIGAVL